MLLPLMLVLLALPLLAQENHFEGQIIQSVSLSPPDESLAPQDLAEKLSVLKPGEPLRMTNVRAAIERLYESGSFQDIVADASPADAGVAVTFRVTPSRFIRRVIVRGVPDPPNRGQLTNIANLQLGEPFFDTQIRQSTDRILNLLRTNGLYRATVASHTEPQPNNQIDVRFDIDSGQRARFIEPSLKGTPAKTDEEITRIARWRKFFGLGPFREVTDSRTQQGLDRILRYYQKKDHLQAKVVLDGMEYNETLNRLKPSLTVEPGPRVTIRAEGARLSSGTLKDLVPVYQEHTVDRDLLVEGKREITEYLQAKGYFEAEVSFEQQTEGDRGTILYSIYPGDRHKLVAIGISGNRYFDNATLQERLFTTKATLLRYRRGRFSQDYLRRDTNSITQLYQQNGFRDVKVTTRVEDDYQGRTNEVAAFFDISEGEQWFISSLTLVGLEDAIAKQLTATLQSTDGQPYSEINVAADTDTILSYFYDQGYTDARLEPVATPVAGKNLMDLRFTVHVGTRRYVRGVLISGLDTTRQRLVMSRIRALAPGSPLSQGSLIESQRRLYDLGIFARVDTALQNPDGDTNYKYVLFRFEEASRWSFNGGIGAQIARIGRVTPTLDTPAGSPGFSPRISFGVSRNNIYGTGHTITLQTQWAPGLRQRGVLTYLAPQFQGNDNLNLTFTGIFDDSRDVSTFTSKRREASAQLSQRLTKANTLQYRLSYRKISVSDIAITPALIPLFAQPVQLGLVSSTFIQDRRDNPIDARRGIWNTIDGAFASNVYGNPRVAFTRLLARNATYHRLTRDIIIARQLSVGVERRHASADVPLPERFFAGGVASHRGFPDNQAGPRDLLTGFPLGGQALLIHNTELRFPLLGDNIGGVLFHDAGNVYSSLNKISFRVRQRDLTDFNYMVHAVGFGIRYRTPVGPVRVDLAWGFNSPRFNGLQGTREQLLNPDAFSENCANLSIGCVQTVRQRISQFQFHFSLGQLF